MPQRGFKHGSGRPKGSVASLNRKLSQAQIAAEAARVGMAPLDYMISVMNDPLCDPTRRDRMAVAAAPFVHQRIESGSVGKKLRADIEARDIDVGSSWEHLLRRDQTN
jgi:hypothetical protein